MITNENNDADPLCGGSAANCTKDKGIATQRCFYEKPPPVLEIDRATVPAKQFILWDKGAKIVGVEEGGNFCYYAALAIFLPPL